MFKLELTDEKKWQTTLYPNKYSFIIIIIEIKFLKQRLSVRLTSPTFRRRHINFATLKCQSLYQSSFVLNAKQRDDLVLSMAKQMESFTIMNELNGTKFTSSRVKRNFIIGTFPSLKSFSCRGRKKPSQCTIKK